MAKTVKEERLAIVLVLTREGGSGPVEATCRADYEVTSEDLVVNRSYSPVLTSAQKTAVINFGAGILAEIKALEEG